MAKNVVVPLLTVATGGALVWAGITDPEGGAFAGMKRLMSGEESIKRTASTGPTQLDYDLAMVALSDDGTTTSGGAVLGVSGPVAAPAAPAPRQGALPKIPARKRKKGKAAKRGKVAPKPARRNLGGGVVGTPSIVVGQGGKYLNPDYFNTDGSRKGKPAKGAASSGTRGRIIAESKTWLGVPYVWGGASRRGVDCSGLTQQVFKAVGISLPHYSGAQAVMGRPVSRANAQPGDLVFFGAPVHHVGIYLGGGRLRHAPRRGKPTQDSAIWGGERVFFRNIVGDK